MKNREILTIADDTTGALDVAGSFFSRGYSSSVALNSASSEINNSSIVFDLNNRYESDETHAKLFEGELRLIVRRYDANNIFLKVDSTLRGHIQSDVNSLREVFRDRPIFIAPAFPHSGRLCINGIYVVEGKPITESVFANDPSFKMSSSDMKKNFPMGVHVGAKIIEEGPQAIIDTIFRSGKSVVTFDTHSQSD
ncbi:MAG TPA: four-carbon acid sugar kinase family protein, partial [Patescibacteria group bacterium]|nr:four-carbon acid sugar kinase family protein [Patescibacteria group bacterium]